MGRSKYKPEYCQLLEDHMSKGYSFASFSSLIKCNRDTIYEWKKRHPEFKDSYDVGWAGALKFYEELLIKGVKGKKHVNKDGTETRIEKTLLREEFRVFPHSFPNLMHEKIAYKS